MVRSYFHLFMQRKQQTAYKQSDVVCSRRFLKVEPPYRDPARGQGDSVLNKFCFDARLIQKFFILNFRKNPRPSPCLSGIISTTSLRLSLRASKVIAQSFFTGDASPIHPINAGKYVPGSAWRLSALKHSKGLIVLACDAILSRVNRNWVRFGIFT